ncbi:hypothetical protein [Paracoccus shanxieyensis]|uniref:Uncharacterized protein n=1 Tax=Paracoccus shanxieyensis TaxID=2675752 RepID=A0A6L6IZ43_9RHOB|nr:hypothetical protein [Paracoccus shanxieyensis]MTH64848.1 hypothetical protein [Paracoccus shanxieyensis]MTH87919.1 hypothetical protein [Paracoccus shanxieyensis]
MGQKFDPEKANEDFNTKQQAQHEKLGNLRNIKNPQQLHNANPPNAGGENREAGDRHARQNDRATNGGE